MKYSMTSPCPHCGGNPKIANPTGVCCHIYYPELVNKGLTIDRVLATQEQVDQVRYYLGGLYRRINSFISGSPCVSVLPLLVKALKQVDKLLDNCE